MHPSERIRERVKNDDFDTYIFSKFESSKKIISSYWKKTSCAVHILYYSEIGKKHSLFIRGYSLERKLETGVKIIKHTLLIKIFVIFP